MKFGDLLHTWRDRLDPADAGFPASSSRRAPGLRREELAQLAGLSVDYVLRLEQGRATNPSAQVVGALARALQVSRDERDQLYRAAGLLPPQDGTISTHVPAGIQRLVSRLGEAPIGVFAADWTLVWWNELWAALLGDPTTSSGQRNLARELFLGGHSRVVHSERSEILTAGIVADLRDAATRYPADPSLARLVAELRGGSAAFEQIWNRSVPAVHASSDQKLILHPEVGMVSVDCDVLTVPGADLRIVTYTAAAGSEDATKLDLVRVTQGRSGVRVS